MADDSSLTFQAELTDQSWPLYSVGIFLIILRTYARWRRVRSPSQFAVDDWLMITAVPLLYTGLIACLNVTADGGGSNLFLPEEFASFSQADIDERIKGSKIVILSEQCMLNVIWVLKACMLFMLARMTSGTTHVKWIRFVAAYVAAGWVAVEIAFFTACRPFSGYWAVPPPNPQCTTLQHYAIVNACFNISSDLLIIAVPIPMIVSLSLPNKQKIGLGVLFSMGTFIIIAAVLTKYYNLSNVYATTYMLWYTREASVAVYVSNLPGIWPLLREQFAFLHDHSSSCTNGGASKMAPTYGYGSRYGVMSLVKDPPPSRVLRTDGASDEIELESGKDSDRLSAAVYARTSAESDERALRDGVWGVHVDTRVVIQRDARDESETSTEPAMDTTIQGGHV
ncbi:hypothetical protein ACEQ8H_000754 [Pleosporales sp. CAS-2024a]